ncbi:hypothetical protein D3C78_1790790 [compost metagenome]
MREQRDGESSDRLNQKYSADSRALLALPLQKAIDQAIGLRQCNRPDFNCFNQSKCFVRADDIFLDHFSK